MYAITSSSYRAINFSKEAAAGEIVVQQVPASVLMEIAKIEAKSRRTELLRSTDWTQVPDVKLTAVEKTAWAVYRQSLRDLPSSSGFPNVLWPSPPGVVVEADVIPRVVIS